MIPAQAVPDVYSTSLLADLLSTDRDSRKASIRRQDVTKVGTRPQPSRVACRLYSIHGSRAHSGAEQQGSNAVRAGGRRGGAHPGCPVCGRGCPLCPHLAGVHTESLPSFPSKTQYENEQMLTFCCTGPKGPPAGRPALCVQILDAVAALDVCMARAGHAAWCGGSRPRFLAPEGAIQHGSVQVRSRCLMIRTVSCEDRPWISCEDSSMCPATDHWGVFGTLAWHSVCSYVFEQKHL